MKYIFREEIVLLCVILVPALTLYFVQVNQISYTVVLFSVLPAVALGLVIRYFHHFLCIFQERMLGFMGRAQVGFLLFFVYIIFYILFSSFVVSFPLGWVIERLTGSSQLAADYALFSVNFIIIIAIFCWIRWLAAVLKHD
ncbi:MAG: hypothetical protein KAJ60_10350 [Desulfobulbaceae bacterium]|nr:hypothetical protein [Desulfobulbaceae bacterium]MCK5341467.1 hypothetical protein [Desulfobulbaceae bacterium]MCK5404026.1 hypothetical protein [Desulfobulbaceae bacterium]